VSCTHEAAAARDAAGQAASMASKIIFFMTIGIKNGFGRAGPPFRLPLF
jgi:hypothetical protein